MRSVVKWFNDEKGFGFIETDKGDALVHYSQIISNDKRKTLYKDQIVEYSLVNTEYGLRAINVKVIE